MPRQRRSSGSSQSRRSSRLVASNKKQNHERWLITYSDLITLLLVFFVIMFAMSDINKVRFATLAQSLYAALHPDHQIPLNGLGSSSLVLSGDQDTGVQSPSPVYTPAVSKPNQASDQKNHSDQQDRSKLQNLYQLASQYIATHHLQDKVSIANQPRGIQITMRDVALFDTGQATLRPEAKQLIKGFMPFFKTLPNPIVVEGYTDNQPIHTAIYPSNWELSAARAMSVVHFLSASGIQPSRLSGIGYGQYHNIAPNNTPAHRQENRRVNIVILRQDLTPGTSAAQPSPHG